MSSNKPNDVALTRFAAALSDPFAPTSLGCQVPDPFPFPTMTYHIHQTSIISSLASNRPCSFTCLPNPIVSLVDLTGAQTLSGVTCVSSTPMTRFVVNGASAQSYGYGAITPTNLAAVYGSSRVVAWGVKISNLIPELTATGRIIIAPLPMGDTVPSYQACTNQTIVPNPEFWTGLYGIDPVFLGTSNILELPGAVELTFGDLLRGDMELSGMYTNSNFWTFKTSQPYGSAISTTQVMGDAIITTAATGIVVSTGNKDCTRCVGGSGFVIYVEGCPSSIPVLQIETIYHLEGSPNFASTANGALISSASTRAAVGTIAMVETAMVKVNRVEKAMKFLTKGALFLDKNKDAIKMVGGMALGMF